MYFARRHLSSTTLLLVALAHGVLYAGAIHQAVRARDLVTLNRILERDGLAAASSVEAGGITPLHLAAATDQAEAIRILARYAPDLNAVNEDGFSPLHWAASRNATEAASALIEAGANLDPRSANGLTPLHFAAHKQSIPVATLLLKAGADPKLETTQGYRPLHLALKRNPESPLAHLLAEAMVDEQGPLHPPPPPPPAELPDPDHLAVAADTGPVLAEPMNEAVPGTFLNVPLGFGQSLAFVWIEQLGLWFGKYEVTNEQFRRFREHHTSRSYEGITLDDPDQPAVYVSWTDADAFSSWLNQSYSNRIPQSTRFRLPTENEWIYAASCGQLREYPWGNEWPPRYGNYSDLSAREQLSSWRGIDGYQDGHPVTCKVQDSGMNEWGIFGMAGNVWEWCDDWFDNSKRAKVRHGGSWDFDTQKSLTIAARGFDHPDAKYDTIGFRLVVGPASDAMPAPARPEAPAETPQVWEPGKGAKPPEPLQPTIPETVPAPEPEPELAPAPLPVPDREPEPWMRQEPEAEPLPEPAVEPEPEPEDAPTRPEPPRLRKRDVEAPLIVIPHG